MSCTVYFQIGMQQSTINNQQSAILPAGVNIWFCPHALLHICTLNMFSADVLVALMCQGMQFTTELQEPAKSTKFSPSQVPFVLL